MTESNLIGRALDWAYDRALAGLPGLDAAVPMAEAALARHHNDAEAAISSLIRRQTGRAAATGFVTGIGGLMTLPVAIPANLAGVLVVQLRLVAAIARLRGYDPRDPRIKTLALACLGGGAAVDLAKSAGVRVTGRWVARTSAARLVPVVGGAVSGTIDAVATRTVAAAARRVFPRHPDGDILVPVPRSTPSPDAAKRA